MLNFQVPQFIEIEDKIFGPLTFRQFVYVAGGAGFSFMFWVYLPYHWLAVIFILPVFGLALALAFYKVNNRSFILVLEAVFRYLLTHKLYIWKHSDPTKTSSVSGNNQKADRPKALVMPKLSESRLKDLSWSLDIREKVQ
ncbi:PrgI family protein [Candidatus Nomurabacteria bacterium]|nr:PrgI family protein [Candidatus Nomurabacteria bacterium]